MNCASSRTASIRFLPALSMLSAGLVLLGVSGLFFYRSLSLLQRGARTAATVVQVEPRQERTRWGTMVTNYYAAVRFSVNRDVARTAALKGNYRLGNTVRVILDPESPAQPKLDSFASLWLGPLCSALGALVLLAAGFLRTHAALKQRAAVRALQCKGIKLRGKIVGVHGERTQGVLRSRTVYFVECEAALPATKEIARFFSTGTRKKLDHSLVGLHAAVFMQEDDPNAYYVDLRTISPYTR